MAVLHDELNRVIRELCTHSSVQTELVRSVIAKHGISLSEPQLRSIVEAIDNGEDSVSIETAVDGLMEPITITSDDVEQALLELENKVDAGLDRAINHALEQIAPSILESLYTALPEALDERRAAQRGFEERLFQEWQSGLDRLEMLIIMADEAGETYFEDLRREFAGQTASQETVLMDVLVALHCRACRTAREIVCLLKAGYADGANARWRSLHEVAVTALFLVQHQGDAPQRYLDHAAVERWRAAREYQAHCSTLGYEPLSAEELAEMQEAADVAIAKYGAPFKENYGWASNAVRNPRPTFAQIEGSLDMSEWRPFFRLACQSVHAGSQGVFSSVALPQDAGAVLHSGATDAGLADPGHRTAISLTMASTALLTAHPNLDGLVTCRCMLMLCDDIGEVLLQAHES